MGLLDDAIREHLELKRSHGGDPSEIERQEREAFGPGGRRAAPEGGEAAPAQAADEVAPEARDDATVVLPAEPAPTADEPLDAPPAAEPEDAAIEAPFDAERDPPGEEEDPWLVEETADPELDRQSSEEDVLEETPDFLQETPEHDRLWFEQKPPRDFDWDK